MTFKEQRNEAVARGVDVVRRRYKCAYVGGGGEAVVFSGRNSHRQTDGAGGSGL